MSFGLRFQTSRKSNVEVVRVELSEVEGVFLELLGLFGVLGLVKVGSYLSEVSAAADEGSRVAEVSVVVLIRQVAALQCAHALDTRGNFTWIFFIFMLLFIFYHSTLI